MGETPVLGAGLEKLMGNPARKRDAGRVLPQCPAQASGCHQLPQDTLLLGPWRDTWTCYTNCTSNPCFRSHVSNQLGGMHCASGMPRPGHRTGPCRDIFGGGFANL